MSRPFFSLVIACYNDGRYKIGTYLDRLLASLLEQEIDKDDLEVILSDDCSPVPFDDIVGRYEGKLNMKRCKTDYNFAPGNTRAKGVEIATGEWLCFADHDDIFFPKALKAVKDAIIERNEKYFLFSDFVGVNEKGEVIEVYKTLNWCHGKWYNIDNLWKPYGIHFVKDLKSHEDIAICTQVSCAFTQIQQELSYLAVATYAWTDNPQSISHSKYFVNTGEGPRYFLEVFFRDYLESTGYVYLEQFKQNKIKFMFAIQRCVETIVYCYIYTQGFQFARKDFLKENLVHSGVFLNEVKKLFNLSNEQVYDAICEDNAAIYRKIRPLADPGSGAYVPIQSLKEWIQLVDFVGSCSMIPSINSSDQ